MLGVPRLLLGVPDVLLGVLGAQGSSLGVRGLAHGVADFLRGVASVLLGAPWALLGGHLFLPGVPRLGAAPIRRCMGAGVPRLGVGLLMGACGKWRGVQRAPHVLQRGLLVVLGVRAAVHAVVLLVEPPIHPRLRSKTRGTQ